MSGKEGVLSSRWSGVDGRAFALAAAVRKRTVGPVWSPSAYGSSRLTRSASRVSEAGSNLVESVAIPLAARFGFVIATVAVR